MKRIFTLLLLVGLLMPATYAQKGLHLGANFMSLSSSIVNQNTWGNGREYDYKVSFNSSFGFDVGYHFNDRIGIYTGYWFTNFGQGYTDSYDGSDYERTLKLKYNVIPVMLRFASSENRVNFIGGVGILFAMMNKAEQEWLRDGAAYNENFENPITGKEFNIGATDVTDRYGKSDIILNIELGARIFILDELYVDATINGGYGVNDINAADWQIENNDGEYNPSHNVYGGFKVGVAYVLFGE